MTAGIATVHDPSACSTVSTIVRAIRAALAKGALDDATTIVRERSVHEENRLSLTDLVHSAVGSTVERALSQTARRLLGRYVLHGEIAAGGMASVHLGRLLGPVGFARTVAIKKLHPQFAKDPSFVAMFLDEARLAARIHHPNVVQTLDVVSLDDELFLVMEYVHGESLARLIRGANVRDEPIPVEVAVSIVAHALHGLHAAHEALSERGKPLEIVHRDVSPQNVMVGVDGVARVLDFGIAKATSRVQVTQDGQLKGKLAYMAPEQIERLDVDRRVDVYAASVVLWEALTGRRLFVEGNPAHLLRKIVDGDVMKPSELAPWTPPELEAIVLRGLSRDPNERFHTARQMADALEGAVAPATTRTVGAWVERTARESLLERADRVAEIEGTSDVGEPTPPQIAAPVVAPPTPIARADVEAGSLLVTHVSPSWSEPFRRNRRAQLTAGGAALLLATLVGWRLIAWNSRSISNDTSSSDATPATSALSSPVAPPTTTAATTSTSSTTAIAASTTTPSPTKTTAPPTPPPIKTKPPRTPSIASATAVATPPKPPSKPDCKPPYTTDAQGIKIPKLECL